MSDYRVRASGEVVTDLRAAFPNVSIPPVMSQEDCDAIGVDPVYEGQQPTPGQFQSVVRSGPEEKSGKWYWVYTLENWTPEQIAEATEAQWSDVRNERDAKLQACDWTQLPDVPLTAEQRQQWVDYRQALRDVTGQSDPFNIVWPVARQT